MCAWYSFLGTTKEKPTAKSSSLPLEDLLRRVTTSDVACVTPGDVERVKQGITAEELRCAMSVLLEDNRYAEVLASAAPSSFCRAAHGLTPVQLGCFGTIANSITLALCNVLPHVTEAHLMEMSAIFNGVGQK